MTLSFRTIHSQDMEFLSRVYASTRTEEMALVDWDDAEKESFLRMQFDAQHQFYQEQFAEAQFEVVLLDEEPVGRLYVDRRDEEIRLIDIALLPGYRNRGLGSQLIASLLKEAAVAGKPVRIHVETFNPAMSLYRRFGFTEVGDNGVYRLMEWTSSQVGKEIC